MQEKIEELLHYYFKDRSDYTIESVPFGLTNLTKILNINNDKYIVRIYNKHTKNVQSIGLEEKITSYLNSSNLSFQVPVFLRTDTGYAYVQLSDGSLGAIISFLEGTVPELSGPQKTAQYGRVVGELTSALSKYDTGSQVYLGKSFLHIYELHPLANVYAVKKFFEHPPFHIPEPFLVFYQEMISSVEQSMDQLKDLPRQLVHHDLLVFNLLAEDGRVNGVLDFDFISYDIRAMELAICINHVLQMSEGSLKMVEIFLLNYAHFCKSSSQEISQLLLLTRIYHIAVLHIYIGQHYSGANIEQNFNYILNQFRTI